ncbi:MAG: type II/IV secretion system protein [Phycisphaeraceae bacterium]|nr:type II/IV secretion system protein [Phycisphaeraceae bacterium]
MTSPSPLAPLAPVLAVLGEDSLQAAARRPVEVRVPPASLSPTSCTPSPDFLRLVDHDFARRHLILSAGVSPDGDGAPVESLLIAASTPPAAVHNTGVALGRRVTTTPAQPEEIASAIDRVYAAAGGVQGSVAVVETDAPAVHVEGSLDVQADLEHAVKEAERDLLSTHGKAPAVRLVDLILFEALTRGASDVHVQPIRERTLVRYRLDGALHTARELPGSLASAVVTRIKVMARLDVAERRSAQDGRATVTIGGRSAAGGTSAGGRRVDLRISTLPSTYGERVVVRLLDPSRSPHTLSFAALGMPPPVESAYLAQVARTSGIVLSTGPTGSGKTTTLYTTLAWISSTNSPSGAQASGGQPHARGNGRGVGRGGCEVNMMTVEDPVEYDLACSGLSVSQTQVDPKKNVTFATGLRHILRQDPDVIMVGEVRDEETARIAVQSSLTGHMVLSTLHTNDAASAIARLLDLGVEPFLVASSLSAVLAQRLVRKVHRECGGPEGRGGEAGEGGRGGCEACFHTGYRGRTGIFELLVVEPEVRSLIGRRSSAIEVKQAARRAGMVTLKEAGEALIAAGETTREEAARVVDLLEEDIA